MTRNEEQGAALWQTISTDELILAARLLLAALFLIFGCRKLKDFSGTVSRMVQLGVPTPVMAAAVATFMELPVAFAVAVGVFTRLSAGLMFFYTLGTALIGHRYWTMTGTDRVDSMDGFYKKSQHHGWLPAIVHYRPGKIFDRCTIRHRVAVTLGFVFLAASHISLLKHNTKRILITATERCHIQIGVIHEPATSRTQKL